MSMKHVKQYYQQICEQYNEMIEDLKELEEEAESGLIEPERIERIKAQIEPIKQNYERWAYMMFLLNQPNKKDKIKKYQRQNMKLLQSLDAKNSLEGVLEENRQAAEHIGE